MLAFIGACLAMLLFVGLKSFQQRNVAFDHFAWIPPTSVAMSWCEFYVLGYVALDVVNSGGMTWEFFAKASALGLAAGTGSLCATLLHGRFLGGAEGKRPGGVSSGVLAQGTTEVRSVQGEEREEVSPYDPALFARALLSQRRGGAG